MLSEVSNTKMKSNVIAYNTYTCLIFFERSMNTERA